MSFLLALIASTFLNTATATETDPCHAYTDREAKAACGPTGYNLDFGYRFCRLYTRHAYRLSPAGQRWIEDTRACLIREFVQTPLQTACALLPGIAQDQHVKCYEETGYCDLPQEDRAFLMGLTSAQLRDFGQVLGLLLFNARCALPRWSF